MGEVEEKEDGLGNGLAGKTCHLAKAKSGLDGDDTLCVWSADEGLAIICSTQAVQALWLASQLEASVGALLPGLGLCFFVSLLQSLQSLCS